jgi:hypothetical protein
MFTLSDCKEYRLGASIVLEQGHLYLSRKGTPEHGICLAIDSVTKRYVYQMTKDLSTKRDFMEGFGPPGELNDTRLFFLLFVVTMTNKELYSILNS